jgi:hypothetical protein
MNRNTIAKAVGIVVISVASLFCGIHAQTDYPAKPIQIITSDGKVDLVSVDGIQIYPRAGFSRD